MSIKEDLVLFLLPTVHTIIQSSYLRNPTVVIINIIGCKNNDKYTYIQGIEERCIYEHLRTSVCV